MAGNNQEALQAGLRRARALPALLPRQGLLRPRAAHQASLGLVPLAELLARHRRSRRPTSLRLTSCS